MDADDPDISFISEVIDLETDEDDPVNEDCISSSPSAHDPDISIVSQVIGLDRNVNDQETLDQLNKKKRKTEKNRKEKNEKQQSRMETTISNVNFVSQMMDVEGDVDDPATEDQLKENEKGKEQNNMIAYDSDISIVSEVIDLETNVEATADQLKKNEKQRNGMEATISNINAVTQMTDMESDVDDPDDPATEDQVAASKEARDFMLLKKIDLYTPILKLSLDRLNGKKDEMDHVTKADYDKLSHLYHVFTGGESNEKLNMYSSCEEFLGKLYDRYHEGNSAAGKRKRNHSGEENIGASSSVSRDVSLSGPIPNFPVLEPTSSITPQSAALASALSLCIHNVVSSVDLGCELDLTRIVFAVRHAEFNPKRFRAVVLRLHIPKTVALIFSTGKVVLTGAKSEADAHLASRKCAMIIQKIGINVKFNYFKIQNMVATCDTRFPVNIDNLYKAHCQFSNYEPEIFSGLIYRVVRPKMVILIFVTGKFVVTGAKGRCELYQALEYIYPILQTFRKQ